MSLRPIAALLFAGLVLAGFSPVLAAAPPGDPAAATEVVLRVGSRAGPVLRVPSAQLSVGERARIFEDRVADALLDPACTPESFATVIDDGTPVVEVCGRELLRATPADAEAAGMPAEALAERWRVEIQRLFAQEKGALYSSRLLRGAMLGILIPVLWLLSLFATRWIFQKLRSILLSPSRHRDGVKFGRIELLTPSGERRAVSALLGVMRWTAYLVLTYAFALSMLYLVPTTAAYASRLTKRLLALSEELGLDLLGLLPRLVLLFLLLVILRVLLRAVDRSFTRSWTTDASGRVLAAAHTTAITLKILLVVAGTLIAGLLLPGPPGYALLALAALAAVLLALGMRDLAPDFLSGLVLFYGGIALPGRRVRVGSVEGEVVGIRAFGIYLKDAAGILVRVPNRLLTRSMLSISEDGWPRALLVAIDGERNPDAARQLLLDAAQEAAVGEGKVGATLVEIVDGGLVFRVDLPPRQVSDPVPRAAFLEQLLTLAAERGASIRSARPIPFH